jgi:hypothetical protein
VWAGAGWWVPYPIKKICLVFFQIFLSFYFAECLLALGNVPDKKYLAKSPLLITFYRRVYFWLG